MYTYTCTCIIRVHCVYIASCLHAVPMDLDVKMKAVMIGATFLIVSKTPPYNSSMYMYMYMYMCSTCTCMLSTCTMYMYIVHACVQCTLVHEIGFQTS